MEFPYRDECRAYVRRGGYYALQPEELDPVKQAWKNGDTFVETKGIGGEFETLKLGEVECVMFITAEQQELAWRYANLVRAYEETEWNQ